MELILLFFACIIIFAIVFNNSDNKIHFGQHRGKKWSEVPESYLHWIVANYSKRNIRKLAQKELKRRSDLRNPSEKDKEAMKNVGSEFEKYVGQYFERQGYEVDYRGERLGYYDQGIDLIANSDYETILIQCKYWKKENSITEKMLREFYGACHLHIDNHLLKGNIKFLYAVPGHGCMSSGAYEICDNSNTKLRYRVFEN